MKNKLKKNKILTFLLLLMFIFTLPGCAFSAPSDHGSVNKARVALTEMGTIEITNDDWCNL